MMLTWCVTSALKKSFKLFQIHSYADTSWDDDRNSRKSTCSSCIMPFSHAQLNVRIIAMSTSAADLIGTCACAQEVQFKRILDADLVFCQYASTQQSSGCIALAEHGHFSGRSKQIHFFLAGCLSQIEMGLSTFIKFLPHSKRLIQMTMDTMGLPWSSFSVLRRLNQRRPWPGVSLPISFRCIALALTTLSTSESLVSMTD